jgi:ferredoxin
VNASGAPGRIVVVEALCHACGACVGACPSNALSLVGIRLVVDPQACSDCGRCTRLCPFQALRTLESKRP